MDIGIGEIETGKSEEFFGVFAHPRLDVMASNVVPFDAIVVEVVEDGNAGLVGTGLRELSVVGLRSTTTAGGGPVTAPSEGGVGGGNTGAGTGPEPSVDNRGLEISAVAAVKVTLAARSPGVFDVT